MNDKKYATNEIENLTRRFLAGATTQQEERRLAELTERKPDATATEKAMAAMLRQRRHSEEEMERWLTEDETQLYAAIVAQRRRHTAIRRWAAAACVAIAVGMTLWFGTGRDDTQGQRLAQTDTAAHTGGTAAETAQTERIVATTTPPDDAEQTAPAAEKSNKTMAKVTVADNGRQRTTGRTTGRTTANMTAMEQIQDLIAGIEAKLDYVEDSVYTAHVEQLINTDKRLNRLVEKIMASGTPVNEVYPPISEQSHINQYSF